METFKHLIWTRECITIWLHPFNESPDISEFGYFEYYPRIVTRHGLITNLTASLFMSRLLTTIMPLLSFTDASFTHHVSYRSLWNRNILLWVHIVNMVLPVNRVPHFIQWFTIMFPTFEWPCEVAALHPVVHNHVPYIWMTLWGRQWFPLFQTPPTSIFNYNLPGSAPPGRECRK